VVDVALLGVGLEDVLDDGGELALSLGHRRNVALQFKTDTCAPDLEAGEAKLVGFWLWAAVEIYNDTPLRRVCTIVTEQPSDPLDDIVRELLLERTSGLDGPRLAAFIDGWGSLLRLLDQPRLLIPGAPPELATALAGIAERIRDAQDRVLDDDE
jgi:hypothetical protein